VILPVLYKKTGPYQLSVQTIFNHASAISSGNCSISVSNKKRHVEAALKSFVCEKKNR
jgi:hypothetical protein